MTRLLRPCLFFACSFSILAATPDRPDENPPLRDLTKEVDFDRPSVYHLGPIGARGFIYTRKFTTTEARQILINEVDAGTPAEGILQPGDVILGIGGKPISEDARKALGKAIDEAEKNERNGVLKLTRWRPIDGAKTRRGETAEVEITLPVLGSFSDTAPYDCPKTERIMEAALKRLISDPKMGRLEPLAFLATGKPEHVALVRDYLHKEKWAAPGVEISLKSGGLIAWNCGFRGMILAEYYLLTGDAYVLPAIREHAVKTAMGQSDAGTWGHGFAWTSMNNGEIHGNLGGYGAVNLAGLHCLVSLILAKKCGVQHPEIDQAIEKASHFFRQIVGRGSIGYGFHQPSLEQFNSGRNGHSSNGKNSVAAMAFSLLGDHESANYFSKLVTSSYDEREFGHSGNSFNIFWGPLGANFGGPKAAAAFHREMRWYYALTRQANGSFAYQQLAGYYGRMTLDPTVAQVLSAATPLRKLYITGKDQSEPHWLDEAAVQAAIDAGRWHHANRDEVTADQLLERLDCWSPAGREWVAKALKTKKGHFVEPLIAMTKSPSAFRRAGACTALGHQGDADAVPVLTDALFDPDSNVQIAAGYALANLGPAAQPAIPEMMRAILENNETDVFKPVEQAFSYSLGYDGGRTAPLYFTGVLARTPKGVNPLDQVDRQQLYPMVDKLAASRSGRVRGCGLYVFKYFDLDDVAVMAQTIVDVIKYPSPDFAMFRDAPRGAGVDLLARHKITDGIDLCLETMDIGQWGSQMRYPNRLKALAEYGHLAKDKLPDLRALRWKLNKGELRDELEKTIRAIETDTRTHQAVTLQGVVSQRFAKDLAADSEKNRERACRDLMRKYPRNSYWQTAGRQVLGETEAVSTPSKLAAKLASVTSPNEDQALDILGLLETVGDAASLEAIAAMINGPSEKIRRAALEVLGASANPKAVIALWDAANDPAFSRHRSRIHQEIFRQVLSGRVSGKQRQAIFLTLGEQADSRLAGRMIEEAPWLRKDDAKQILERLEKRTDKNMKGVSEKATEALKTLRS